MNQRPKTDVVAEWLWEREFECRRGHWREQPDSVRAPWLGAARDLAARLMDFGFTIESHSAYARVAMAPFEHDLEPRDDDPVNLFGSGPVPISKREAV